MIAEAIARHDQALYVIMGAFVVVGLVGVVSELFHQRGQ